MFTQPTIARFASQLSNFSKNTLLPEIIPQDKSAFIPLSYSQQGLWFIDKLQGTKEYHIPIGVKLSGDVNFELLERSLRIIVERHEILRTVIKEKNGIGYQELIASNNWTLSQKNIENTSLENQVIIDFTNAPFDLAKDYTFRACLYKLPDNNYVLVCVFHHIASDGWSLSIFTDEFTDIYDSLYVGKELKLPKLPIQYSDYSIWQRKYISEVFLEVQLSYWENKLKGTSPIPIATDYARPAIQSTAGSTVYLEFDTNLKNKLNHLCKQEGVTLFMLLLSGLKILLTKYSGQNDICIGTPIANRNTSDVEQIIGCFINTIALRSTVDQSLSFKSFLQEIKETTLEGYDNGQAPFDKVVEQVIEERDMSITPIFQIMFGVQNTPALRETGLEVLKITPYDLEEGTTQFDLNISANEHETGISLSIEYCTDLFKEETVQKIFEHYKELLNNIILNQTQPLSSLAILNTQEQEQLLYTFNYTKVNYDQNLTIVDLFQSQVKNNPNAIALSFEGTTQTYDELDKLSNKLAHYLVEQGVVADDFVGICLERSFNMVVGILGILKAGGAYVPIKPDYPTSRIKHILEDINCAILVTDVTSENIIDTTLIKNIEVIALDSECAIYHNKRTEPLTHNIDPNSLSYVIYTSGSTGTPKGALIEHKGLLNHLLLMNDTLTLDKNTTIAFTAPFTFDISVWQILSSLLVGGKTAIYKEKDLLDTTTFVNNLTSDDVTILQLVPSYTASLLETTEAGRLHKLKYFLVTGEAVTKDVLDRWFQAYPNVPVVNAYGPAEASDDVTLHIMTKSPKDGLVSIGKPVANMEIYIVNSHENLCPIGVIGELWVGGVGVGRGYLNLNQLTKEKFITNPFTGNGRVYKTGDLGRWLSDGTIEFVGRIDDQVKIRGHRIELGEIENALSSFSEVISCCVLAKEDGRSIKNLIGYVVLEGALNNNILQEKLQSKLPDYMVPRLWVVLDEIPLTPNGKVNKKALLKIEAIDTSSEKHIEPKTDTEKQLAEIWQELLGISKIGTNDNFFELGGHSLIATQLVARIRQYFNLEEISVVDIFSKPVLLDLAITISNKKPKNTSSAIIQKIPTQQDYELSHAQKRMWVLNKLEEGQTNYNIPYALQLVGNVDVDTLNKAIQGVINKYEILRTIFITRDDLPRQKIITNYQYTPSYTDISNETNPIQKAKTIAEEQANFVFNLENKPPFEIKLLKIENEKYVFLFTLHHIISDGWSAQVLLEGILENYKLIVETGKSDEGKLEIQYKDYSVWQNNTLNQKGSDSIKQYWNTKFSDEITPLKLPFDKPRESENNNNGASQKIRLSKQSYKEVKLFAKENQVTLFTVLMSLFKTVLYRYSDQNDIIVGTPTNGRDYIELEDQIGFFVNTLAIRSNIKKEFSFNDLLNEVKTNLLEGYKYQMYPFDKLVNDLNIPLEANKNPIFDILVDFQSDKEINEIKNDFFEIEEFEQDLSSIKFDLFFSFTEENDGITVSVDYKTHLFSNETIERMLTHLTLISNYFISNPDKKINDFDYLSKKEFTLLEDLNKTALRYSKEKSVIAVFKEQVIKTPNNIALA
ncbi:non-ribosomal peptide synthetase, partial [Tenacibaculum ovolyticum]|uniref:non-ribosomal peptide synthetase n=1 Tax=Tenacibaculum ovolyticum TaxID=104270 RepID=UPI0005B8134D